MLECDVLIVGGGPGGSTCAWKLQRAGFNVVVLDRATFPRDKVCGGWLTPEVFRLLEFTPDEYRATGLTLQEITGFRTGVLRKRTVETNYGVTVSYAIRRCEFDEFLLRRANVNVLQGTALSTLRRDSDHWIANNAVRTPLVIGAGGHFCPVAHRLRKHSAAPAPAVVAKEAEFRVGPAGTTVAPQVPELFFCNDLDGYAWCVRKGDFLNIGIGRRSNAGFGAHVNDFMTYLEASGKAPGASRVRWHGHAYLASGAGTRTLVDDGVMLIGDAAGLAYPESGEGIRPAIESAVLAANIVIAAGGRYRRQNLLPYQDKVRRVHPSRRPVPTLIRTLETIVGRALLASPSCTRHLVLDRWFLRRDNEWTVGRLRAGGEKRSRAGARARD